MHTTQTFIALKPNQRASDAIEALCHKIQRELRLPHARWTRPDAWLVKMHKLGNLTDDQLDDVCDALPLLPKDPLSMSFWKLELMESNRHATKIVLKLTDPTANTFRVHKDCYPIILRAGLQADTRPWFPHIVLGHVTPGRHGFDLDLSQIHVPQFTFSIASIGVYETQKGSRVSYEPLESLTLNRT